MPASPSGHGTSRTRSWWGWGYADSHPDDAECVAMGALLPGTLARPASRPQPGCADRLTELHGESVPGSPGHLPCQNADIMLIRKGNAA